MFDVKFQPDRSFQVWLYTVSHKVILLRSVKSAQHPSRIDVCLFNVSVINLSSVIVDLHVRELTPVEASGIIPSHVRLAQDQRVFSFNGENCQGFVVAGTVAWHEDELEYDDQSFFSSAVPQLVWK